MSTYLAPGVYIREVESGSRPIEGVGTAVAAFVGFAPIGETNTPVQITNWSQYRKAFGDIADGFHLAHAVYGFFQNGGGRCYVVRVGAASEPENAHANLMSAADESVPVYEVTALDPPSPTDEVTVEVAEPSEQGSDAFDLIARRGTAEERHSNLTTKRTAQNVVTIVNGESKLVSIKEVGRLSAADRRPAMGLVTLAAMKPPDPADINQETFVGDPADRTGFGGLEAVDEVTMLAIPDLMAALDRGDVDLDTVKGVQTEMIGHCERMGDRVAILDTPANLNADEVGKWRQEANYDSKYAALYYPWLKILNPATGEPTFVPPSGHIAGVWSRTDATRGVHKAPANEVIRGVLDVGNRVTGPEQEGLNPNGINVIRAFPGRGTRIWGARTLSSDSTWRYINVRRLFNYIEESIEEGTQWVVFEPNDQDLWQRIRRTVSAFLTRTWRDGALFGSKPEEAFYVKCDEETNPQDVIDAGQVVIEIGIAPVKPAEFVVFHIAQFSGGALVSE
jgi:Bacteriophage tail sheath protein